MEVITKGKFPKILPLTEMYRALCRCGTEKEARNQGYQEFYKDDAKGYDYPEDGSRPIVVFAQIGGQQFLYELVMPNNRNYKHIKAFVDAERFFHPIPNQRKDSCYRQVYPCRDIIEHIKNLGLMKWMEQ